MFRVIPVLTIIGNGVYRTRRFADPVYVGDPMNTIKIFNEKQVDELVVLDIGGATDLDSNRISYLSKLSLNAYMPMAYGGHIRRVEDAKALLRSGYEKIIFNTALVNTPEIVRHASQEFGSQAVVASVDVRKDKNTYQVFIENGRVPVKEPWLSFLHKVQDLGIGELYIRNIDHDGELLGYDLELTKQAAHAVSVPVVALGGAGAISDLQSAKSCGASAAAAGSWFVFYGRHRAVLINCPMRSDLEKVLD